MVVTVVLELDSLVSNPACQTLDLMASQLLLDYSKLESLLTGEDSN